MATVFFKGVITRAHLSFLRVGPVGLEADGEPAQGWRVASAAVGELAPGWPAPAFLA
jgi:hypothetical protein